MRGQERTSAVEPTNLVGPNRARQEKIIDSPDVELRDGNTTAALSVHVLKQAAAERRARARYSPRAVEDIALAWCTSRTMSVIKLQAKTSVEKPSKSNKSS